CWQFTDTLLDNGRLDRLAAQSPLSEASIALMVVRSNSRADQPPPLDDRHAALLEELSRWMDAKFRIPILGWRFGLDALLGLIPGLGDTATSAVSLYIL